MIFTIIGAGWLGHPLALQLHKAGHQIKTTTRDETKRRGLIQQGLACEQLSLQADTDFTAPVFAELMQTDCLIITLPPGIRHGKGEAYLTIIKSLLAVADKKKVAKVLLTSSSGVYPEQDKWMDEEAAFPHNEKARLLLAAESLVAARQGDYLICRLTGLFGGQRDPARFVKRMSQLNKRAIANMLHQKEAVAAIYFLLQQEIKNQCINISSQIPVTKVDFYQAAIARSDVTTELPPLVDGAVGKCISTAKLAGLGYSFIFADAIAALAAE
ncbi:NAD(P)H-binding protein [Gayadomonas joobiniege]|uniref:NAD(P)H-binding protein n=1 Tax=Gayadomonas joobiniege TaxID=1234606 RepID=UPI000361919A|nr:NAD(P)H-binding protein [Gayadomonas joobiniege]